MFYQSQCIFSTTFLPQISLATFLKFSTFLPSLHFLVIVSLCNLAITFLLLNLSYALIAFILPSLNLPDSKFSMDKFNEEPLDEMDQIRLVAKFLERTFTFRIARNSEVFSLSHFFLVSLAGTTTSHP